MMYFFIMLIFVSFSVFAQEPNLGSTKSFPDFNHSPHQFIGKQTGVPIAQARPEDITPENYPYKIKELNFPEASLREVIKAMSVNMGINLIMDPTLGGTQKISIISYLPLTVAEYYQAFLSVLAMHNLAVLRSGPFLKVVTSDIALKSNLRVHTGDKKIKTDQFLTSVIKLKHISADSLQSKMKPFIDEKSVKSLIFYPPSNAVIVSDYGSNLNKIKSIIKSLDVPSQDSIFEVLPIKHAQASQLVKTIQELLPSKKRSSYRYRASKSSKPSSEGQSVDISALSADTRTNSIIVMGNKAGVNQVKDLVRRLDYYTNPDLAGGIYVYKVKHGQAEELAGTLTQLMKSTDGANKGKKGKGPTPQVVKRYGAYGGTNLQTASTALAFEDINIIAEKNTNSLLIVANYNNYQNILEVLKKVDISHNQVFVKSIIMEINTSKNNNWKIANYFFPEKGGGLVRMGYGLSNLTDIINPAENAATLFFPLSLFLGKSFSSSPKSDIKPFLQMRNLPIPSSGLLEVPTLSSFVRFLQKNVGANILSTPQVMALDHQQAEVVILEKIPQVSSRTQGVTNTNFTGFSTSTADVETALIITPHINPDVNSIRLEIEQKIDDVIPSAKVPAELQGSNVAIKKRKIKTFITLKDKETAVLGGLVRESNSTHESKIPILGDLPLIGWLFKNSQRNREKTNLIVFVTPHIVRSAKEHSSILSAKLKERMNFIRKFTGNEDPYKEVIDNMQGEESLDQAQSALLDSEQEADFVLDKEEVQPPTEPEELDTALMDSMPSGTEESFSDMEEGVSDSLPSETAEAEHGVTIEDDSPVE